MKHHFTEQQLSDAYKAALNECGCGDTAADYMNAFLNALPEPVSDEWQECRFEDIQKGDRVKWVNQDKDRDKICIGVAHRLAYGDEVWVTEGNAIIADISVPGQFYRIPAPVQHPDPEVNHFIRINGKDYEAIPDSGRYQLIESKWSSPMVLNVEHITEWEELELIPKVVEDDS